MAEWIGHLMGSLPQWLFLPALIVLIILSLIWAVIEVSVYGGSWPLKTKREYLGEKKHDKK